MICVVRVTEDGRWLWAWWFADTIIHGKLVLERFAEFVASESSFDGLCQFVRVRDCWSMDDSLDYATVPLPNEVMSEASVRVRRGMHR